MMGSRFVQSPSIFCRPNGYHRGHLEYRDSYDDYPNFYTRIIEPFTSMHMPRNYSIGADPRGRGHGRGFCPGRQDARFGDMEEYEPGMYLDGRAATSARRGARATYDDDYAPKVNPLVAERKESIAFCKAIAQLHRQLGKAADMYKEFMDSYDGETQPIKKYASKDILDRLWILRVKGERDPETFGAGEYGKEDENLMATLEKFELCQRKTAQALRDALSSTMNGSENRIQSAERLKEKVKTAYHQILELQEMALSEKDHCAALLNELDELKAMIDPTSAKNKAFKTGGSDENELSETAYGGGYQNDWGNQNNQDHYDQSFG
jgi:hypothetical protein